MLTSGDGGTTFMKLAGAGVGFGLGVKDYREVIIFRKASVFERFRESGWEASGQAEATRRAAARPVRWPASSRQISTSSPTS